MCPSSGSSAFGKVGDNGKAAGVPPPCRFFQPRWWGDKASRKRRASPATSDESWSPKNGCSPSFGAAAAGLAQWWCAGRREGEAREPCSLHPSPVSAEKPNPAGSCAAPQDVPRLGTKRCRADTEIRRHALLGASAATGSQRCQRGDGLCHPSRWLQSLAGLGEGQTDAQTSVSVLVRAVRAGLRGRGCRWWSILPCSSDVAQSLRV